jgi:hypothetical protein
MAGVIVPLIASLAPSIISLIAGLVHKQAPVAETTHGPGTGPVKFTDVFNYVITALQSAAAAGQIDKALPSDDAVKTIIQSVVTSMKLTGLLGDAPAPTSVTVANGTTATSSIGGVVTLKVIGGTIQFQQ